MKDLQKAEYQIYPNKYQRSFCRGGEGVKAILNAKDIDNIVKFNRF